MARGGDERARGMKIGPGSLAEAPAAWRLSVAALPEAWSYPVFAETIRRGAAFAVAEAQGRVVGYALAEAVFDELHLLQIVVAASHRRQGIGAHLIRWLEGIPGMQRILLEARVSNTAAIRFYERMGFAPVGIRPRYYAPVRGRPAEDALVMEKRLAVREAA